jgi:hypothetical protein
VARDPADELHLSGDDQINVSIPGPLNARLDALVELANGAGERTSRRELISALILAAPEDGPRLAKLVREYRLASVRDAVVPGHDESLFLEPPRRRPGPRPRA